jgi:hypothetical protein
MYHVIQTKYLGPTNTKGSRIKATCLEDLSITMEYIDKLSGSENHRQAAALLCNKCGWNGTLHEVESAFGRAYVLERKIGAKVF